MAKPTVLLKCVANSHAGRDERIIEFNDREHNDGEHGGLISFRRVKGELRVDVYCCGNSVKVRTARMTMEEVVALHAALKQLVAEHDAMPGANPTEMAWDDARRALEQYRFRGGI